MTRPLAVLLAAALLVACDSEPERVRATADSVVNFSGPAVGGWWVALAPAGDGWCMDGRVGEGPTVLHEGDPCLPVNAPSQQDPVTFGGDLVTALRGQPAGRGVVFGATTWPEGVTAVFPDGRTMTAFHSVAGPFSVWVVPWEEESPVRIEGPGGDTVDLE